MATRVSETDIVFSQPVVSKKTAAGPGSAEMRLGVSIQRGEEAYEMYDQHKSASADGHVV